MTQRQVLIAFASRNGSTAEIAVHIGEVLRERGFAVRVQPAGDVRSLDGVAAVILGSALYANRWRGEACRFARRHEAELRDRPVWLFSSGPLDDSASHRHIPPVPDAARIAARIGARGHVTFGGRLTVDARGFIARAMARNGRAGDFRDFAHIAGWATLMAADLGASAGSATPTGGAGKEEQ
jgi:menaquinone-dependent protoporphyrinogen oxidase